MATALKPEMLRQHILAVLDAALRTVDPHEAILANLALQGGRLRAGSQDYALADLDRIVVVGGGKAGTPMAAAAYGVLGDRIAAGSVNVKIGHTSAAGGWRVRYGSVGEANPAPGRARSGPIRIVEAGHPIPDAAGLSGSERIAGLLSGLTERDLAIVLISGGGSALLPLPVPGITLADYQQLTGLLLRSGADITEINAVRKHCSQLQGGQLVRLAAPAQVVTLILSDVVGSPLDAIASGPTAPDRSTFGDAWAVLQRYDIVHRVPASVVEHLRRGVAGDIPDTPKAGDPLFGRVNNVVIGDNALAGRAAVAKAQRLGYNSTLLTTFVQGEAREVGRVMAGLAQGIAAGQSDYGAPACLVLGGETTVTIRGSGMGGRNQELALDRGPRFGRLRAAPRGGGCGREPGHRWDRRPDGCGRGHCDAGHPEARKGRRGSMPTAALDNNDSYRCLGALGDLLITGPAQTNVNDLIFVFVR